MNIPQTEDARKNIIGKIPPDLPLPKGGNNPPFEEEGIGEIP